MELEPQMFYIYIYTTKQLGVSFSMYIRKHIATNFDF